MGADKSSDGGLDHRLRKARDLQDSIAMRTQRITEAVNHSKRKTKIAR